MGDDLCRECIDAECSQPLPASWSGWDAINGDHIAVHVAAERDALLSALKSAHAALSDAGAAVPARYEDDLSGAVGAIVKERDEARSQLAQLRKRSEVTRAWITETCIANRGRHGAVEEALQRLRRTAHEVFDGWGERFRGDAKLHFVLQIERPTEPREGS